MIPVGVDGCKGGWLAVAGWPPVVSAHLFETLPDLLRAFPDAMILIDTPIGLPEDWSSPRATDREARAFLTLHNSEGHRSPGARVFPAPPRPALEMFRGGADYPTINRASTGQKLTLQAFHILGKIDAADRAVTPALQSRIREGHPELAFARAAGRTLPPKKTGPGRAAREALLSGSCDIAPARLAPALGPRTGRWAGDDLMDACILTMVARACLDGTATRLPHDPERDERGLRMEIWS